MTLEIVEVKRVEKNFKLVLEIDEICARLSLLNQGKNQPRGAQKGVSIMVKSKVSPEKIEVIVHAIPEIAQFRKTKMGQEFSAAKPSERPTHIELNDKTAKLIADTKKTSGLGYRLIEEAFNLRPANGMTAYRVISRIELAEKEAIRAAKKAEKEAAKAAEAKAHEAKLEKDRIRRANAKAAKLAAQAPAPQEAPIHAAETTTELPAVEVAETVVVEPTAAPETAPEVETEIAQVF